MIERQKTKYGWEFLFLGANIDAAKEAARFGISAERAVDYKCDEVGTALNYDVISEAICTVRASRPLSPGWKARICRYFPRMTAPSPFCWTWNNNARP